jgi:subtilisin-like proprotein convertase family protein
MKFTLLILGLWLNAACVQAAVESYTFTGTQTIPDANPTGLNDTRTISSSAITEISSVIVTLNISSGYNGDLYAYLRYGQGSSAPLSILLNRVGKESSSPTDLGYGDSGFQIRFSDSAANGDIHTYRTVVGTPTTGQPLTGDWQVDGRSEHPAAGLTSDSRNADNFLSAFNGVSANGDWTLFIADVSSGGVSQLNSWGLEITAVPEVTDLALPIFAAIFIGGQIALKVRARRLKRTMQGN